MRIIVVSGHYPPNFVSGGSLQPERLARGLRALGHDVRVYAGRIDPDLDTGTTLETVDETGLPVRWFVTTPWDNWADDHNWQSPEVHDDFYRFAAAFQPDIVHLHDLQMLGGSLVRAAKEAGAKVVVTMHDFWWFCARLFLVDRHLHPCSLVVDAGSCGCEVNHRWLMHRNEQLRQELAHADLVLGVSNSSARVLASNGVAVDRLAVDENGLPAADLARTRPTVGASANDAEPEQSVRFVYAGGAHDLKGSTLVLKAAAELEGTGGWALDTYGIAPEHPENLDLDISSLPVRILPSFAPAERDAVFESADFLIVPSIMLETHSILTREALGRGVPVVCSNTLGPEEVVKDGVNGLIFPVGDVDHLAAVMRSLIEDPALRKQLRAGCEQAVTIRSLDAQVSGLEQRYAELLAERPPHDLLLPSRPATHPRPELVVFMCGIEGAPLRYRARLAAEAIAPLGVTSVVKHYRDPALEELVQAADVLYVYRVPATHQVLDLIGRAKERGIPVLFDVDDLIFDPDVAPEIPALKILSPPEAEGWLYGVCRYRTTMEACDGFVGSTPMLTAHAHATTGLPTAQFDNGVGLLMARLSEKARRQSRKAGPLRLGYLSGTITHDHDWFYVEPALIQILERHEDVQLWMAGHLPDSPALEKFARRIKRIPFLPWTKLPQLLNQLDVNLAPLEPGSRFNEAKSAIKWLEAALVGTPTVASATGPFRSAIDNGVSGWVADDLDGWVTAVDRLLVDERHRILVGQRARREALLRWSPHLQGQRFLEILDQAHDWRHLAAERPDSGWVPAVADEPFAPLVLEPYTTSRLAPMLKRSEQIRAHVDVDVDRVQRSLRTHGVGGTARRALPALRREASGLRTRLLHRARTSRATELATYTRRMVDERGLAATASRASQYAQRRALLAIRGAPGIRHIIAIWQRLIRSLRQHGIGGTVNLARPLVRHKILHSLTRVRVTVDRLRRKIRAVVKRR